MSGILDSRTRILDTILTSEGRKQMAEGRLKVSFYSFTDSGAIYKEDTIISSSLTTSGSIIGVSASQVPFFDSTYRLTLESTGLPQDMITFTADDSGRLNGVQNLGSERYVLRHGEIYSGSVENQRIHVTGSLFASLSKQLLSGSINAFQNQMILKSPDPIDDREKEFLVGPDQVQFNITKNKPFDGQSSLNSVLVEHAESFFQDKRLSNLANYQFLPPVNKARAGSTTKEPLGNYINLGQKPIDSYEVLEEEFVKYDSTSIRFTETSRQNNLIGQFFELAGGKMTKLDVIDYGFFLQEDGLSFKHVFFVGKVFIDDYGNPTFMNLFSLVFED